ncbi:glycosyltransferase family 4 protein [Novipirellula sp. SH528]|uniref:glycosyltransferase family 4 protein n=1 Tax=Novipirellula sp. SH528 TaxID=3454466 RepID=UPI003FA0CA4D
MSPLRIAFLCNEYPPGNHGGIGSYTRNLARALVQCGHDVRIFGCYKPNQCTQAVENDHGVKVYRMPEPKGHWGWVGLRWKLYQKAKQWSQLGEIDLIEIPDWQGWGAVWPRLSVPVLCRLHGSATYFNAEAGKKTDPKTHWLERASLRRADRSASTSRYTDKRTREVFQLPGTADAILHNFVPLNQNCPLSQRDKNTIVFAGTLTRKKGVISLIQAWPDVVTEFPNARLHLFGKDGALEDGTSMQQHLLERLGEPISRTVIFQGHQPLPVLSKALQTARAAVFPSYAEAFALAPLEAMACGCPTIYTERGSGHELMENGVHGLLIDPDNTKQISEAIKQLLRDDELAGRLGNAGWKKIEERFCPKEIVPQNEQFFRKCIEQFKRNHA